MNSLPPKISAALNAAGGSMPLITFLSPDGETNFGSFNHTTLKNQEYNKIFRDVKKKIKTAQKEGELKSSGAAAKADGAEDAKDGAAESDAIMIASPRVRTWKSSNGKEIQAKFIKFENDTYFLRSTKGRDIKVTAKDLDDASIKMAEEIININKK